MKRSTGPYIRQLGLWLRIHGVEGSRVVTILSEVRAHVSESGENPYETFGEPRIYAKAFAEGSRRRWVWITSLVVAIAAFVLSIYLLASEIASQRDYRPLPFGGHRWLVISAGIIIAIIAWRAILVVAVRPLSSLAYDKGDASTSWKKWAWHRRFTTVATVVVLVVGSALWGESLGGSFRDAPKLHSSTYVWSNATAQNSSGQQLQVIATSTVLYLSAPGPETKLVGLSLSTNWDSDNDSSNLIAFPTLSSALETARDHNFSGTGDNAPFTTLKYGTYYVLQYFTEMSPTVDAPTPLEDLNVKYSVAGVGDETLKLGLPIDYGNNN